MKCLPTDAAVKVYYRGRRLEVATESERLDSVNDYTHRNGRPATSCFRLK
jgi:hypothetical protein